MKDRAKSLLFGLPVAAVRTAERALARLRPTLDGQVRGHVIDALMAERRTVRHNGIEMTYLVPNPVTVFRATSFSDKEPETLDWIDGFVDGQVMWDVGANVGLYAIYAALRHPRMQVFAFEPSVMNLELLARNIALNGLEERITVVPVALFGESGAGSFRIGGMDRGGALSAFGVGHGFDGTEIAEAFSYRTLGAAADDIAAWFGLATPDHVKIDVDGVEHLILQGMQRLLADPALSSVLVEINDGFAEQRDTAEAVLGGAGLVRRSKSHGAMFDRSDRFAETFNQIWQRG